MDLRADDLDVRRFEPRALRGALSGERAQLRVRERREPHFDFGDALRERDVLEQRGAVVALLRGEFLEMIEHLERARDAGGAVALVLEQKLGVGPTAAFLTDEVRDRHADVLEDHFVDLVAAVDRFDRTHRDAGRRHVDEDERDALLLLRRRIGAREDEDHVRVLRERDPRFLTVDHVMIAVAFRTRGERREIGTGTRLRVALTPPILAREDAGQVVRLLLFASEVDDHRRHHRDAERKLTRREADGQFLVKNMLLHDGPVRSAVFDRPIRREVSVRVHDLLPRHVVLAGQLLADLHLVLDRGRELTGDERANLIAEA